MSKCEFCGIEHDGSYASGRFCSPTCSRKYSNTFVSEEGRKNQIKALNDETNRKKGIANNKHVKPISPRHRTKKEYRNDLRPKFKHTLCLGKIGELEVGRKFLEHGYDVYIPLVDTGGADLVVNNGNGFKTVQVKSSTDSKINMNGECETTIFKVCKNIRHIHEGSFTQIPSKYSPDEIDYIALYSAYDNNSYLLENTEDISMSITIRNVPSQSKRKSGNRYAEDYQIDNVLNNMNLINGVYYNDENIIDCEFKEVE